jgi:large subunit ribosomal protein L28e
MVSALVWQLIKNNNSFLVKRGRTARAGAVQFSSEKGNVLNVNSAKYSGLATETSVHVDADLSVTVKVGPHFYVVGFCDQWV